MNCWYCDRPAHGICQFCGRAVCRDHVQYMPYILAVLGSGTKADGYKGLVVPEAIYCGVCKPKDEPVLLEPLNRTYPDKEVHR